MNSKIDILIKQLCPNGVEKVHIKDCCTVSIGEFVHKDLQSDDYVYPVYNGGTSFTGFYEHYNNSGNKVIVSARGANAGFVNRVYSPFWAGNSCYSITVDEDKLNWDYLYYVLKSSETKLIESQQKGGGIPSISKAQMERFQIPLPPLAIQQEIVNILDKFTSLIDKIDEEINLIQKQYEYYREKLLKAPSNSPRGEWEWKKLGEVATFRYGFTDKAQDVGNVRYIRITDITNDGLLQKEDAKYLNLNNENESYLLKKGDLLMARTGATYGKTLYFDSEQPSIYASFLIKIDFKDKEIEPRYYWIFSKSSIYWNQASKLVGGGAQPQFNANAIAEVLVPLPPKAQQQTIVQTLDKFETLIGKLKEERALRQKQYEYYREKLLTF